MVEKSKGAQVPYTAEALLSEPPPARRRILRRLETFVRAVCHDPVFRRQLKYQTLVALNEHGFDGTLAPSSLSVRHHGMDALVNSAQIFGFYSSSSLVPSPPIDLRLVAYGRKPAALVHGAEAELVGLCRWAERRSLTALLSPSEWEPINDQGKGGFSNLTGSMQRARAGSGACRSLVIAQDEDRGVLMWLCLLFGWDEFLGRLLGYPSCCTKAFGKRWTQAVELHQGDPAILSFLSSERGPYDWKSNIFGRYFGYQLLQHFPCRLECAHTLTLGQRYAAALEYFEPDTFQTVKRYLQAPILYTELDGVVLFPEAQVQETESGWRLEYDPQICQLTEPTGHLSSAVRATHSLISTREAAVQIGDEVFAGYLILFAQSESTPNFRESEPELRTCGT